MCEQKLPREVRQLSTHSCILFVLGIKFWLLTSDCELNLCTSTCPYCLMLLFFLSAALVSPADSEVIDLKVMMMLEAFNVLVCDQSCNMADIKIQGTESQLSLCLLSFVTTRPDVTILMYSSGVNGSLLMQGPQTHLSAHLRDFIVLNVDPKSIHKKVSQLLCCVNVVFSYRGYL